MNLDLFKDYRDADFLPIFWSSDNYKTFEEAKQNGAIYKGESCSGSTAYTDAMINVLSAATCLGHYNDDNLMVNLSINGRCVGDFSINDCY